ncbi:MAG TPA: hypothetical protein VGN95_19550 [Pyrinomonadaceae bacterium]|jgi:hypothetical protein|nr:hypothetical protein [Pyrinomonadaceae bacterium]
MQRNDNTPREERTFAIGDKADTQSGLSPTDDELNALRQSELYQLTTDQAEALARHLVRNVELEDDNLAGLLLPFRTICFAVGNDSERCFTPSKASSRPISTQHLPAEPRAHRRHARVQARG